MTADKTIRSTMFALATLILTGNSVFAQRNSVTGRVYAYGVGNQWNSVMIQWVACGQYQHANVACDDKTEIMIDGDPGRVVDLRPGDRITAWHRNGLAYKIFVSSFKKEQQARRDAWERQFSKLPPARQKKLLKEALGAVYLEESDIKKDPQIIQQCGEFLARRGNDILFCAHPFGESGMGLTRDMRT